MLWYKPLQVLLPPTATTSLQNLDPFFLHIPYARQAFNLFFVFCNTFPLKTLGEASDTSHQLGRLGAADAGIPQHFHTSLLDAAPNYNQGGEEKTTATKPTNFPFCRLLLETDRGLSAASISSLL